MFKKRNTEGVQAQDKTEQEADIHSFKKIAAWSVIGVVFLWALTFFLFFFCSMETRAHFGDMFGAVNALFSGLAFAGLIITLMLQRKELALQRDELQLTRDELKNQRIVFERENETIRYQRFENLFYNMLDLQQRIVDGLKYKYTTEEFASVPLENGGQGRESRTVSREVTGRDVFRYIFVESEFSFENGPGTKALITGFGNILYNMGYSVYEYSKTPTRFDHYFRHLYKILQFVDGQGFPYDEAYKYVSFLRGTLSRYELVWLYYNALSPRNRKMKELIQKYSLLKNLRPDILSRTKETSDYFHEQGLPLQDMEREGFSCKDFEHYLTNDPGDPSKFYLSAFWKPSEIGEGQAFYERWVNFVKSRAKSVPEEAADVSGDSGSVPEPVEGQAEHATEDAHGI